jgi:hypothetical protein
VNDDNKRTRFDWAGKSDAVASLAIAAHYCANLERDAGHRMGEPRRNAHGMDNAGTWIGGAVWGAAQALDESPAATLTALEWVRAATVLDMAVATCDGTEGDGCCRSHDVVDANVCMLDACDTLGWAHPYLDGITEAGWPGEQWGGEQRHAFAAAAMDRAWLFARASGYDRKALALAALAADSEGMGVELTVKQVADLQWLADVPGAEGGAK